MQSAKIHQNPPRGGLTGEGVGGMMRTWKPGRAPLRTRTSQPLPPPTGLPPWRGGLFVRRVSVHRRDPANPIGTPLAKCEAAMMVGRGLSADNLNPISSTMRGRSTGFVPQARCEASRYFRCATLRPLGCIRRWRSAQYDPAPKRTGVMAARERLEPEGSQNGVTAGRDPQLVLPAPIAATRLGRFTHPAAKPTRQIPLDRPLASR